MGRRVALVAAALAVAGCGSSQDTLTGSISTEYDLSFDSVQVQLVTNQYLVVSYLRNSGIVAKPAKLTVDMTGVNVTPSMMIDLVEMVNGGPRGTLQRVESTTINFPLSAGNLVLDSVPAANQNLCGHFHCTMSMPMGQTMNGDFCAPLQVVM
jgi:hypothetical protein